MDSRGAPQGIGRGHRSDEGGGLGADRRTARSRPAGAPGPVRAKAAPLPPEAGVGGHDHEGPPPPGPDPRQPDPQEAICPAQPGPWHRSLVHGELVTQGEVLEGELAVAAAEEQEESKQVEPEGDHRSGILSGSEPTDQPLAGRTAFWRRTGWTFGPCFQATAEHTVIGRGRVMSGTRSLVQIAGPLLDRGSDPI